MQKEFSSINPKYQYIGFLPGSVRIKEGGFWGINDYEGNEILPSNFIEVFTLSSGYGIIAARDAGFWDIYDYFGNKLNKIRFDSIYPYYGMFGMSKVKVGNNWGLLNRYGKIIIPIEYTKIEKFGKGICLYGKSDNIEFIEHRELMKLTIVKDSQYFSKPKKTISSKFRKQTFKKSRAI